MRRYHLLTEKEEDYLTDPQEKKQMDSDTRSTIRYHLRQKFEAGMRDIALLNRNRRLWATDDRNPKGEPEFEHLEDEELRREVRGLEEIYQKLMREAISEVVHDHPLEDMDIPIGESGTLKTVGKMLRNGIVPDPPEAGDPAPPEGVVNRCEEIQSRLQIDTETSQPTVGLVGDIIASLVPRINTKLEKDGTGQSLYRPEYNTLTILLVDEDYAPAEKFTITIDEDSNVSLADSPVHSEDHPGYLVAYREAILNVVDPAEDIGISRVWLQRNNISFYSPGSGTRIEVGKVWTRIFNEIFDEKMIVE